MAKSVIRPITSDRELYVLYDTLCGPGGYFDAPLFKYAPPVEKNCIDWAKRIMENGVILVAIKDEKIVGSHAISISRHDWNNKAQYLHGAWLWVHPDFRGSGLGKDLIKAAQDAARNYKVPLMLGAIWGFKPEVLEKIQTDLGFAPAGANYIWFPPTPE